MEEMDTNVCQGFQEMQFIFMNGTKVDELFKLPIDPIGRKQTYQSKID